MAKPYAQTGHGPISGAADESALPNGEASRRGADENADSTKSDWGLPDSTDESRLSRILGLILVLVLVGVFSFVAYRKYNEARLHPTDNNTVADNSGTGPAHAGSEPAPVTGQLSENANNLAPHNGPTEPASPNGVESTAGGTNPAPNQNAAAPSAFQQLDEQSNPGAPFHPTEARSVAGQSAEGPASDRTTKPSEAPSKESEVNPFNDVATNTTPATGTTEQAPQPGAAHSRAARPNSLASEESRNDQAEPLFNEDAGQPSSGQPRRHGGMTAKVAANTATNPDGGNEPAAPQTGGTSGQARPGQFQPVQNEQFTPVRVAAAPNPPVQSEPATNDLSNDSPKAADVAQHDHRAAEENSGSARQKAPAGGLLDQEEPLPTASRTELNPIGAPSSQTEAKSALASSQTAIQHSPASPSRLQTRVSDNEDLFATKTADAKSASDPMPIPQKQAIASDARNTGADAALNEAGDFYVVQPQDTFWTISRKKYGTARYFMALAQLNKAHVPDATRMRPGVKVSTPPTEILETRFAQYLPKGSAVEVASGEHQGAKPAATGFFVNADGRPMYRTGEKDTLSDIAAKHLGRGSRWIQIFEMNRDKLTTPNQLKIGTELALPGDASNVAVTNENEERR